MVSASPKWLTRFTVSKQPRGHLHHVLCEQGTSSTRTTILQMWGGVNGLYLYSAFLP